MSLKSHLIVPNWPMQRRPRTRHSPTNKGTCARVQSLTINPGLPYSKEMYLFACCVIFMLIFRMTFSKSPISKHYFWNTIWVSNSLDPDQARQHVGSDLSPDCLQRLPATALHVRSRQRFKVGVVFWKANCLKRQNIVDGVCRLSRLYCLITQMISQDQSRP